MKTMRVMSVKPDTAWPSIAMMRSPGCRPAASAGDPATTSPTRGSILTSPRIAPNAAKIAMARMKFAIGPAATMSARCQTGLKWKTVPGSACSSRSRASCCRSGALAAFSSPRNRT